MEPHIEASDADRRPQGVHITIDRKPYLAPREKMTGAEIRKIPNPDIPGDRDLWLEVPHGDDNRIDDTEVIHIREGQKFYTAPKTIDPGAE